MKDRQQILYLIVGLMGLAAVVCGLFGIGGMNLFWRLVHIAGGGVMVWSVYPVISQFIVSRTKK